MKYASFDIVFQEIPGEVTLALNLTNCPMRCVGCHSPHLQQDTGEELTQTVLANLIERYKNAVTCLCFMGGDAEPQEVIRYAVFVKNKLSKTLKTAWYSGKPNIYAGAEFCFDYIKTGAYIAELGALTSPRTNQRLYKIENGCPKNITEQLRTKK